MEIQKINSCSLERMIGFIVEINLIRALQFILYETRKRERLVYAEDEDIFTYKENKIRKIITTPVGESIYTKWIQRFEWLFQKEDGENFGLTSKAKLMDGRIKHIPMIDFKCSCSDQDFQRVVDTIFDLGERKGFILESGNSYHYWGTHLLKEEEWRKFMERCREQETIGDTWPSFQIEDGFSVLRISISSAKPQLPRVIAKVGNFKF